MDENRKGMNLIQIALNIIVHILLFGVAGYIIYLAFEQSNTIFSWHKTLMATGYLILVSNAIMSMNGNHFLTGSLTRSTRVTIHWVLQGMAIILITSAFIIQIIQKSKLGLPHFKSAHSLFGLTTVIFTYISILGGIVTKFSFELRHKMRPIISKTMHSFNGIINYILGITTICFAIYTSWFKSVSTAAVRGSLVGVLAVTTIYVLYKSILTFTSRVKTMRAKE